ncbi:MAG: hypothetical protein NVS4B2_23380 [Chloroflexota bacterium]
MAEEENLISAPHHSYQGNGFPRATIQRAVDPGLLICCGAVLLFGLIFVLYLGTESTVTDYFAYYAVSKMVLLGHAGDIYSFPPLLHFERLYAVPLKVVPVGVMPNVLPPFFALLLAPIAALPFAGGYLIWTVVNCLLLGWSLYRLMLYARVPGTWRVIFCFLAVIFTPVLVALFQGQVSLVLLALLTGMLLALRHGRDVVAGSLLSLTLVKPQYAIAFLVLLLFHRRWRGIAAFMVGAAVLTFLPLPILGASVLADYVHTLLHAAAWGPGVGGFNPSYNRSFAGFFQLLLAQPAANAMTVLLDLVVLASLALAAARNSDIDLPFALTCTAALLVSQHVLIHDLSVLVLPAAIALRYREMRRKTTVLVLAGVYLGVSVGFLAVVYAPVQVPTIAVSALGLWLWSSVRNPEHVARQEAGTLTS